MHLWSEHEACHRAFLTWKALIQPTVEITTEEKSRPLSPQQIDLVLGTHGLIHKCICFCHDGSCVNCSDVVGSWVIEQVGIDYAYRMIGIRGLYWSNNCQLGYSGDL